MEYRIETLGEMPVVGMRMTMSFANDRTAELWRSFMPRRREIVHAVSKDLISMQRFDGVLDLKAFDPQAAFDKMAAVAVKDFSQVPEGMEAYTIKGGLYAVFHYKGDPRAYAPVFHYIFGEWIPQSGYVVDDREHFEVLGEKYKNNDPESEEEIWVPVQLKI